MYFVPDIEVEKMYSPNGFLYQYIKYGMSQTDAPCIFHLATGLSILSAALPPELHYWGPGSESYPNLYTLIVGRSGIDRKTISMRIGSNIFREACPDRVGVMPASHGALVAQLEEHPQQILFDEDMARFLREAKGQGYLSGLKQGLISAYDCPKDLTRSSLKDGTTSAANVRLNLFAAANMTELSDHIDLGDLSSGFFSRFLFFSGSRSRWLARRKIHRDAEAQAKLVHHLKTIHACCPRGAVVFSEEAQASLDSWESNQDLYLRKVEDPQEVSLLARIPEFTRKIATIVAVDDFMKALIPPMGGEVLVPLPSLHALDIHVRLEHVQVAANIAQAAHSSVMAVLANLHPTQDMRDRATVLNAFPPGTPVTLSYLLGKAKMLKPGLVRILDSLVEEGLIQKTPMQAGLMYLRPAGAKEKEVPPLPADIANAPVDPTADAVRSAPGTWYEDTPSLSEHPDNVGSFQATDTTFYS